MKIFLYNNIFVAVFGTYICWSNCRPFLFFMLLVFLTVFFWYTNSIRFIKLLYWVFMPLVKKKILSFTLDKKTFELIYWLLVSLWEKEVGPFLLKDKPIKVLLCVVFAGMYVLPYLILTRASAFVGFMISVELQRVPLWAVWKLYLQSFVRLLIIYYCWFFWKYSWPEWTPQWRKVKLSLDWLFWALYICGHAGFYWITMWVFAPPSIAFIIEPIFGPLIRFSCILLLCIVLFHFWFVYLFFVRAVTPFFIEAKLLQYWLYYDDYRIKQEKLAHEAKRKAHRTPHIMRQNKVKNYLIQAIEKNRLQKKKSFCVMYSSCIMRSLHIFKSQGLISDYKVVETCSCYDWLIKIFL